MSDTVLDRILSFSRTYGRDLTVDGIAWRYYRLGSGPTIVWLTGGLRRAAYGYGFMEWLARSYTVIAPDYPPVKTAGQMMSGIEAILHAEAVERFTLGGQSYGGLLAQILVARRPQAVGCLLLSSTGPADYRPVWGPIDSFFAFLVGLLPERTAKKMLAGGLLKAISAPEAERAEWEAAVRHTFEHDLTRADMVSHFAVAADAFGRRAVRPEALQAWTGRVVVLSAENDPTQGKGDRARYERLFGRPVEWISMGEMGHTAALTDPDRYVALLEQALA